MIGLMPTIKQQYNDVNGNPLTGGLLYSYIAGTTIPTDTYTEKSGVTANTNPIVLDTRGEASVWISSAFSYKFKLAFSDGTEIWTVDDVNVTSSGGGSSTDELVKVNAGDLGRGYLSDKLIAAAGVTLTLVDTAGVITMEASFNGVTAPYINSTSGLTATTINAAIDEVDAQVDTNVTNIATNTTNIASNDTDISNNTTNIATNTTNIATNASNIATNTSGIATNTSNIATNTTNIATNTTDIATNTTSIATNTTNIATNVTAIGTNTTNIATNATNIATNTSGIATNVSGIATNVTNIATNTSNISTNVTNIATNTANITSNDADIATNVTNIATNTAGIATNVTNIATNTNAIDALAKGLDYQGTWNASTNSPALASSVGTEGHYYIVGTAGNTNLNGTTDWEVGDWVLWAESVTSWQKVDNTSFESVTNVGTGVDIFKQITGGTDVELRTLTNGSKISFTENANDIQIDDSVIVSDVATNTSNIATNVTAIATNATNISSNDTDIATNVTAIATNATDIAANTTLANSKVASVTGGTNVTITGTATNPIINSTSVTPSISLQDAYDDSTTPEITTDATNGALSIKRGSALDTDNVLEVQNGAGTNKFEVTGEGNVTISGVLSNIGGQANLEQLDVSGIAIFDKHISFNAHVKSTPVAGDIWHPTGFQGLRVQDDLDVTNDLFVGNDLDVTGAINGGGGGGTFLDGSGTYSVPSGIGDAVLANTQTFNGVNTFSNEVLVEKKIHFNPHNPSTKTLGDLWFGATYSDFKAYYLGAERLINSSVLLVSNETNVRNYPFGLSLSNQNLTMTNAPLGISTGAGAYHQIEKKLHETSTSVFTLWFTDTKANRVFYQSVNLGVYADWVEIGNTPKIVPIATSSSLTIDASITDQYNVTALASALTINAPTNPTNGQKLTIRIKDNGTTRTLTWNAIFRAIGTTLPTNTTANKTIYVGAIYNSDDNNWDVVAVSEEA